VRTVVLLSAALLLLCGLTLVGCDETVPENWKPKKIMAAVSVEMTATIL